MTGTLIYTGVKSTQIYLHTDDHLYLKQAEYFEPIIEPESLMRLLPQLELPVTDLKRNICDSNYRIEDIIPFNELVLFLFTHMKSGYWVSLACNLLLDEQLQLLLSPQVISYLRKSELEGRLPQKELHLVWKLLSKMRRLSAL
ncbi:hypothetical protein [Chitinophaga sp. Cy-1792]|uniref:hypothetical protein n=1 Tax=Chitinophaga sp. Cy-1792 TaxID=2608339 RepID=UPI001420B490|nr:hypothetical protein [Chitinophaga sp. Cy-1792]NIG52813.1 hypothetical protein [Chitinophaga sp. Cy-1792]